MLLNLGFGGDFQAPLLLVSSVTHLGQRAVCMILILLYLLKFVLGPTVYPILVHIQFTLKKKVSLYGASLGLVGLKCCLDHPYAY